MQGKYSTIFTEIGRVQQNVGEEMLYAQLESNCSYLTYTFVQNGSHGEAFRTKRH